jgi:hypothetical protein
VTPENVHQNGLRVSGDPIDISIRQEETAFFGFEHDTFSLGQIVEIRGRGFVGRTATNEGTTTIRLEGAFTPYLGELEYGHSFDLVGRWYSGNTIEYEVTVTSDGRYLRSVDFGVHRGLFQGTATPILDTGSDHYEGEGVDLTLRLGPVRQIVWVRFLPGFSESLELFGLGAVEDVVKDRIVGRIQEFYHQPGARDQWVNVEFRTEQPEDFYAGGYAILAGKDVGNLRLHDHVGGENALGALDGYGYGGVFIESMLYFSEHPPSGNRPPAAPPAEPRFDDVFDPIRDEEVVAGEYPAGASQVRVAQIELAISVLASMIGDTAAHEFGHSLGLAQPYGGPEEFHNLIARDGCLMDSGRDRPFEERTRLDGNEGAAFCGENLFYLQDLLPLE